jgi:2'-5' RNA ligase
VLLPAEMRSRLGEVVESLRATARGVAWVAPANLHVTVKFLGAVEESQLDAVRSALATAAAAREPFDLAVEGLGAFPAPARPRVVWAGLGTGAAPLAALAGEVDRALAALGFPREARPFSAHVTLGRVREPRRDPALAAAIARAGAQPFGALRVERLALMQSQLSPSGARYTELAALPLGAPTGQ